MMHPVVRLPLITTLTVKVALVVLLAVAVLWPELPQFEGKAFAGRALTYPISALVVPLGWWIASRRRRVAYPYAMDILIVLPFLIDTAGNALDLYDTIEAWDDVNHFVNWAILTGAVGRLFVRSSLPPPAVCGLLIGFGAVSAILWEFAEFVTFIRDSPEEITAYEDTLGDLGLGLGGSVCAAVLTVALRSRSSRRAVAPATSGPAGGPAT
jgi:hypothetical protein